MSFLKILIFIGLGIGLFDMILAVSYLIKLNGKKSLPFTLGPKTFNTTQDIQSANKKVWLLIAIVMLFEVIFISVLNIL